MYVHGGGGGLLVDEGQWSKRMYNRGNTEVHAPMVVPDAFSTLCVLCVARTTLPATHSRDLSTAVSLVWKRDRPS